MHYAQMRQYDIANGPGVRMTLFVSGCTNHCEGCFQPETWDFQHGTPFTEKTLEEILAGLALPYVQGFTLLGGEPMEPRNQPDVHRLLERIRWSMPKKDIWIFSGFTFERLLTPGEYPNTPHVRPILELADVLVDGPFILAQKDLLLRFRGSKNQRLLDLPASLQRMQPVLWDDHYQRH